MPVLEDIASTVTSLGGFPKYEGCKCFYGRGLVAISVAGRMGQEEPYR